MKLITRRLADYVRPAEDATRADRLWRGVVAAEHLRKRRRELWRKGAVLLAAALVLLAAVKQGLLVPTAGLTGLVVDAADQHQSVVLPDGSRLEVTAGTRLLILGASPGETRIKLERGTLVCDVVPRSGRSFVVQANDVEVEVRGTRFEVSLPCEPSASPTVRVERGAVEVRAPGASPSQLHPGERWPAPLPAAPDVSPTPPARSVAPAREPPAPSLSQVRTPALSAAALLERASNARLAGRDAEAAAELERLVRLYPADPRAGLASFQLGRLRAGPLRQPRAALEAFAFALEHAPDDAFREDAAAGRIEAAHQLGDTAACRRWQAEFLQRHPASAQVPRVKGLCGP